MEPDEGSPSFFKVILNPSASHLTLPNAFVSKYLNKIPNKPTLVTKTGGHSWKTEFVQIGEDYCFALGWEKLVNDVGLCSKDIVIFWQIDPLTFLVSFLGANGCEKHLPVIDVETNDDDGAVGGYHDDDESMPDEKLCFQKVLNKACREYMTMPVKFVKAAGLEDKQSIKLKDHEGSEWNMTIRIERSKSRKYFLSAGWVKFSKHHKLSEGDVCTFTFNKQQGVLNLTQLYKAKTQFNQTSPMQMNGNVNIEDQDGCRVREMMAPPPEKPCRGGGVVLHAEVNVRIEDKCSPLEKPCVGGGGVKVKTEYELGPENEVATRKRGRPLFEEMYRD